MRRKKWSGRRSLLLANDGLGLRLGFCLRIQDLGESGIIAEPVEIGVVAGLEAICRVQADSIVQTLQCWFDTPNEAFKRSHPIMSVIRLRILTEDLFEVAPGVVEISIIDQRDGKVIMFLWRLEGAGRALPKLLQTSIQVN